MITPDGIEILGAARKMLRRIESDVMRQAWGAENDPRREAATPQDCGRVAEAASAAEAAIFNFLNVANTYGKVEMTYEQLHAYPKTTDEEVEV